MTGEHRETNKTLLAISFACMLVAALTVTNADSQELKIGAGAAPTENVLKKIQAPMEASIGIKLTIVAGGPVEALKDLDKGVVDAAAGGLAFSDWMKLMEKSGYNIADTGIYKRYVIGRDTIKVIVNKGVAVRYISRENLKGIFTGAIGNWKPLTGQDMPIRVVWGEKIPGTQNLFQQQIMGGQPYAGNKIATGTATEVKEMVLRTPGAVGLAPISLLDDSVSAPGGPEVARPITLLTRGNPSPLILKMLGFIDGEGKKYLSQ